MSGVIKILVMINQSCRLSASVVGVCHTAFLFIGYVLLIKHSGISLEADKVLYHYKKKRNYVCLRSMSRDIVIRGNLAVVQLKIVLKNESFYHCIISKIIKSDYFHTPYLSIVTVASKHDI